MATTASAPGSRFKVEVYLNFVLPQSAPVEKSVELGVE
jgi:hypothetical protein